MKKKYKIIFGVIVCIICVVSGVMILLKPLKVEKETVQTGNLEDSFVVQGTVTPENSTLISAQLSGQVTAVKVSAGEAVQANDVVVEIDDSTARGQMEDQIKALKLQQSSIYAQGKSSKAQVLVSKQQLEQQLESIKKEYESLFGSEGSAEQLYNIAKNNYANAKAAHIDAVAAWGQEGSTITGAEINALEAARGAAKQALLEAQNNNSDSTKAYYESTIASYESQIATLAGSSRALGSSANASAGQLKITIEDLENRLAKGPLTAPFDGIMWEVLVENGSYVVENQPIARIYEGQGMKIAINMLSEDALELSKGDVVNCETTDGSVFEAEISFVSPLAQETISTLGVTESRCLVELEPTDFPKNIGAGHKVDITFVSIIAENVVTVPTSAIISTEDGYGVYLIKNGEAVLTAVETGQRSSGRVEIKAGMEAEDVVITNPDETEVTDGKSVV